MKHLKRILILGLLVFLLGGVCWAAKIEVKEIDCEVLSRSTVTYSSFWEALRNLDLEAITRDGLATNEVHESFYYIYQSMLAGNHLQAAEELTALIESSKDSEIRQKAKKLLVNLWFSQSNWDRVLEVQRQDEDGEDLGLANLYTWSEIYSCYPSEEYVFKNEVSILPLKFQRFTGHPLIEIAVEGKKYRFAVDTGAATTVLSSRVAEKCGIQTIGAVNIITSADKKTRLGAAIAVANLSLGDIDIANHPIVVVDKSEMEVKLLGIRLFRLDGILGWNAIKNINMTIDCPNKQMILKKPTLLSGHRRNLFDLADNLPVLILNDQEGNRLNFGLDTGSNISVFFENILNKISDPQVESKKVRTAGIGYSKDKEVLVLADLLLNLDGWGLQFKEIQAMNPIGNFVDLDGWFGFDILKKGVVTIDHLNGIFNFNPAGP